MDEGVSKKERNGKSEFLCLSNDSFFKRNYLAVERQSIQGTRIQMETLRLVLIEIWSLNHPAECYDRVVASYLDRTYILFQGNFMEIRVTLFLPQRTFSEQRLLLSSGGKMFGNETRMKLNKQNETKQEEGRTKKFLIGENVKFISAFFNQGILWFLLRPSVRPSVWTILISVLATLNFSFSLSLFLILANSLRNRSSLSLSLSHSLSLFLIPN